MIHTFYVTAPMKRSVFEKIRSLNLTIVEIDFDTCAMGEPTGLMKVDLTGRSFEIEQFHAYNTQFENMGL